MVNQIPFEVLADSALSFSIQGIKHSVTIKRGSGDWVNVFESSGVVIVATGNAGKGYMALERFDMENGEYDLTSSAFFQGEVNPLEDIESWTNRVKESAQSFIDGKL